MFFLEVQPHDVLSAQTAGSERERVKKEEGGRRFSVRSEEQGEEERQRKRLIMKVFQIASPWRSGAWRGFRGFGLSTGNLTPGV